MERTKLATARYEKGWSQEEVAERVGVTRNTFSKWERGVVTPYPFHIHRLCKIFGKTAQELELAAKLREPDQRETIETRQMPQNALLVPDSTQTNTHYLLFPSTSHEILFVNPQPEYQNVDSLRQDWSLWFGSKLAQLITLVDHWQGQAIYCNQLQTILDQEIVGFNAMKPQINDSSYVLSRRQALITIATLPAALGNSVQQGIASTFITEKLLTRCAASITALWHLLKGSELSLIEQTLSTYLLTLVTLAQQPSLYQKTASKLASQAYRLYGITALHRNNLKARENYCQQALYYSELAENTSLIVSAYISLASTFYYKNDPIKAAQIYQKALMQSDEIPPLQRSRIHAELAVAYAQQKQEQEALEALGIARDLYPDHPENDPSFLYAEFSPASMILEEGLAYLALAHHFPDCGYKQDAQKGFARIEGFQFERTVPERVFFEITNHQAATSLVSHDLDQAITYLEKGIEGAQRLNSKRRRQEAVTIYEQALTIWPYETRLERLQDLFHA